MWRWSEQNCSENQISSAALDILQYTGVPREYIRGRCLFLCLYVCVLVGGGVGDDVVCLLEVGRDSEHSSGTQSRHW